MIFESVCGFCDTGGLDNSEVFVYAWSLRSQDLDTFKDT